MWNLKYVFECHSYGTHIWNDRTERTSQTQMSRLLVEIVIGYIYRWNRMMENSNEPAWRNYEKHNAKMHKAVAFHMHIFHNKNNSRKSVICIQKPIYTCSIQNLFPNLKYGIFQFLVEHKNHLFIRVSIHLPVFFY